MNLQTEHYKILQRSLQALLIFVLVYITVQKLGMHRQFYLDLQNSPWVANSWMAQLFSWGLPFFWGTTALLLVWPATYKLGLYFVMGFFLLASLYIIYLFNFAGHIPCSCGGILRYFTWPQQLLLNAFILIMAFSALLLAKK